MNLLKKIKSFLGCRYRELKSKMSESKAKRRLKRLKNRDFTIIADNCWGGFIYQRYGLEYRTPTIGLFFYPEDYIKFLERLEYYLSCEMVVKERSESKYAHIRPERKYYIGVLDDVEIQLLHYHSKEEAVEKWNRRKERICLDNCLIKMSNRTSLFTADLYERFEKLPYKNKILFTHEKTEYPSCVYVSQFKKIMDTNVSEIPYTLKRINERELIDGLQ